ncbi:uncharacterized protein LOC106465682 isoform X2 [Limulus polyphemus]|uniref:Uncharacterized protein LOC106465682 isoform X2 n=1 Tax=Limulus polyphemus TaxID=6850 RepID=A0ABM1T0B4_LIMPO|nr:uncharacterized protein LOC106465682 isoform X2 [Limulus polyphemus]
MAAVSELFPVAYPTPEKIDVGRPHSASVHLNSDVVLEKIMKGRPKFKNEDSIEGNKLHRQLRTFKSQLLFLQAEHAMMLEGLHDEINRLQTQCRELQLRLVTKDSPSMCQVTALESAVSQWQEKSKELSDELEISILCKNNLHEQIKVQEWQFEQELASRDEIVLNLQRELDLKCNTILQLSTHVQQLKEQNIFKRMSLRRSQLPKCDSNPKDDWKLGKAVRLCDKVSPFKQKDGRFFPPLQTAVGSPGPSKMGRLQSLSGKSSESSDGSFMDSLEDEQMSIDDSRRGSISSSQSNLRITSPKIIANDTQSFDLKLPPVSHLKHAITTPNRTFVRQQIKINSKATGKSSDVLGIDKISHPSIEPKTFRNT